MGVGALRARWYGSAFGAAWEWAKPTAGERAAARGRGCGFGMFRRIESKVGLLALLCALVRGGGVFRCYWECGVSLRFGALRACG